MIRYLAILAAGFAIAVTGAAAQTQATVTVSTTAALVQAVANQPDGTIIEVTGGTYSGVTLRRTTAGSVAVQPTAGATVRFSDRVEIYSPRVTFTRLDFAGGWVVWDGVRDNQFINTTGKYLYIFGGINTSVIGGSYGPSANTYSFISATAPGAPVPTNILIDGVTFHDYTRTTPDGHTECLHAVSVQTFTIRNSRFINCAVMDLFLTINPNSPLPFRNLTIENNFFGRTIQGGFFSMFVDARQSFENVVVRFNSFAQAPIFEVAETGTPKPLVNFVVDSNLGEQWGYMCNPQVVYRNNVWFDGARPVSTVAKCGATDIGLEDTADPGWVNQATTDLHLKAGSVAINRGNQSSFPVADIDGDGRSAPDAGADELAGTPPPPPPVVLAAPTNLRITASNRSTVTLAWDYTATVPITGFRFYVNGVRVSTGTNPAQRSTRFGVKRGTTATLGVAAYTATASSITSSLQVVR